MKIVKRSLNATVIRDWRDLIQKPISNMSTDNSGTEDQRNDNNKIIRETIKDQLIPLYCTLLSFVIFGLIVYVIYKLWKQNNGFWLCNKGNKKRYLKDSSVMIPSDEIKELNATKSCTKKSHLHKSDSLLNRTATCLPYEHFETIVFSLGDESTGVGWTDLAKHEGISSEEIKLFQSLNNKQDSARAFLKAWSESPNNTLKKLIKSLQEISRPDTALLIKSCLSKMVIQENNNNINGYDISGSQSDSPRSADV